ncbi:unnamed protein product [Sphagnum jensenii]|uniref:Uncharacterized protein n=1 Tax=Sphagnum jensenii TaxID=128206 RepID=A0ABP0VCN0_9BRYO
MIFPHEQPYTSALLPGYRPTKPVLEAYDLMPRRPPRLNKGFNMLDISQQHKQQQMQEQFSPHAYSNQYYSAQNNSYHYIQERPPSYQYQSQMQPQLDYSHNSRYNPQRYQDDYAYSDNFNSYQINSGIQASQRMITGHLQSNNRYNVRDSGYGNYESYGHDNNNDHYNSRERFYNDRSGYAQSNTGYAASGTSNHPQQQRQYENGGGYDAGSGYGYGYGSNSSIYNHSQPQHSPQLDSRTSQVNRSDRGGVQSNMSHAAASPSSFSFFNRNSASNISALPNGGGASLQSIRQSLQRNNNRN